MDTVDMSGRDSYHYAVPGERGVRKSLSRGDYITIPWHEETRYPDKVIRSEIREINLEGR